MPAMLILMLTLLLLVFFVVQAFWSYKLRHFFRLFPGLLAGVLISLTTGYLIFMDGTRGDLTRLVMNLGGGKLLAEAISNGDLLGLLRLVVENDTARDILMKVLPDSAKVFMIFAVLVCIASTIVCAALEKPGIFLELFAYGYTVTASICTENGSTFMGVILGIAVGALLGMLGYKISRGWIIVVPNLIGLLFFFNVISGSLTLFSVFADGDGSGNGLAGFLPFAISLAYPALPAAIPIGVRRQFKATAVPKDGAAQSVTVASGPRGKWAEKFKLDFWDVIIMAFVSIVLLNWFGAIISLVSLVLLGAIRSGQSQAAAVPRDGAAQSPTAVSGLKGKWVKELKFDLWEVMIIYFLAFWIAFGNWLVRLLSLAGLVLLVAIRSGQSQAAAVPKDGAAQSPAASGGPRGKWAEKFKAVTNFVPTMPPAQSKANPLSKSTPSASGQKFCHKCGNSLAPGAKFCAKCGTPTRSGEDATKPM